jgi:hypothetical protein
MSESEGLLKEVVAPPWSRESAVERLPVSLPENANARWLVERVEYLRQMKAPSEQQRLLILLAEKPDRSPADDRKLAVLVRAEKADERLGQLRGLAAKVVSEEKAAARKARNHRLIQQGVLFDLVGLESRDPAELVGALAALAEVDDPARWAQWKTKGQAVLARKAEMSEKG